MLIAIVGATGTGKSRLSLDLVQRLSSRGMPAEVVNADAMQLYRGMNIGTAKLSEADRLGIPHHLLDVLEVRADASVASYQRDALAAIADIQSRGGVPLLVGGSGLYVSSVLFDFRFPGTDARLRAKLEAELDSLGPGILFTRLSALDPAAAVSIGPHNGRRMVRALEVIELTGEPFGSGLPDETALRMPARILGLVAPRDVLVDRLDRRVDQMWAEGLVEEAESLLPEGLAQSGTAGRAIGYAQALAQLAGQLSPAEAMEQTRILTRKYARRQVGWFRRYPAVTWLDSGHPDAADLAFDAIWPSVR